MLLYILVNDRILTLKNELYTPLPLSLHSGDEQSLYDLRDQ